MTTTKSEFIYAYSYKKSTQHSKTSLVEDNYIQTVGKRRAINRNFPPVRRHIYLYKQVINMKF